MGGQGEKFLEISNAVAFVLIWVREEVRIFDWMCFLFGVLRLLVSIGGVF